VVLAALVAAADIAVSVLVSPVSSAAVPAPTTSYYEATTDSGTLAAQGRLAGAAGSQGLVILDFGRPAVDGSVSGTSDFSGAFASFTSIASAAESFIRGYLASAPAHLRLDLAIGTNDSCGPGQPCGTVVCGCTLEPSDFAAWGGQLAATVTQVGAQMTSLKTQTGYTDTITVMAGDDAEPGFDPEYHNTYELMAGYATAVRGYGPAMIDYGSADAGFWSPSQLLQVADGFKPNLAVPEIYTSTDAGAWSSLADYAHKNGQTLTIYGVLSTATGSLPADGYNALVGALQPITGQSAIRWPTTITH
jgi:hypothetical protein